MNSARRIIHYSGGFIHTSGMQLSRLRGRKTAERLLRRGFLWRGKHMTIRHMQGAPSHPLINPDSPVCYVGTAASTKLDKSAVRRNRMRRRCREALRLELKGRPNMPPLQLLLTPRSSSLEADFDDIRSDVVSFLSSLPHG